MEDSVFLSAALTINVLYSLLDDTLIEYRKKKIFLYDYIPLSPCCLESFKSFWIPLLRRGMFFEVIICILLFSGVGNTYYTSYSRWFLFLPQIIMVLFYLIVELFVFISLCWHSAFKNGRPYFIGCVEFIFMFVILGSLDIILPSLFDVVSERTFTLVKNDAETGISYGDGKNSSDITSDILDDLPEINFVSEDIKIKPSSLICNYDYTNIFFTIKSNYP